MNFRTLEKDLHSVSSKNIVFIGLGNSICGDDGAGLKFIEKLQKQGAFQESCFIKADTTPENYLGKILKRNPEMVIFIDTARMGTNPGTIQTIESQSIDSKGFSTHTYSIKLIEYFLSANGVRWVKYIGIEPKTTEISEHLSSEVSEGINRFFNRSV